MMGVVLDISEGTWHSLSKLVISDVAFVFTIYFIFILLFYTKNNSYHFKIIIASYNIPYSEQLFIFYDHAPHLIARKPY